MPDNDQFKIIIDDSALDRTIEKAKKTSAELTAQFNKASENLRSAFGKAFAPNQLQSFVDQVKSKLSELQSGASIKAPIDIDVSKISTATGTVKSLRSEVALLQSTASAAADALQGHFGGVLQGIIQHLKNLQMERKILEDNIAASAAKGYKALPGGGVSGIRIDSLKGEEREAQTALNLLTNVLGKIEGVQNALDRAIVKVQSTPSLATAVRKAISTSGSKTPLPKDEVEKDLREYVKWHQEQTNRLRDALDAQLDNMEHAVAGRRRSLPDIKSGMARKQALQLLKDQKELDALYKEIVALRRDPKASQDILGALSGPDLTKLYDQFLKGDVGVETLNTKISSQIENARTVMRGLQSKHMRVMEEFPEFIRTGTGDVVIPGLPKQAAVPVTQTFASPAAIQGIEKEIAQLKKLGDQSLVTQNRIKELQAQVEFLKTKPITEVPAVQAGVRHDVALAKKYYKAEDYHPGDQGDVEELERFHQKITGLGVAYQSSTESADLFGQEVGTTGAVVRQAAEQHKPLLSMFESFDRIAGRAGQLFQGVRHDASEMPSVLEKVKQVNAIIREPILHPGAESFEFSEKLKGSIGNATGYVKRELADTTFKAQEHLFKFGKVVEVMGDQVTRPFQKLIQHIKGFKDETGKLQGLGSQFRIGEQTPLGEKVPYLKAFEDRISRIQSLMMTMDTAPAETFPKLEKEILSLSTSLTGVGNHYKKINTEASEMGKAFRVQPLINELRSLFTSPDLSASQLVQAQVTVERLNSKFSRMVSYAPELEPLRKQIRGISDEFLRSKAFMTTEKQIPEGYQRVLREAKDIDSNIDISRKGMMALLPERISKSITVTPTDTTAVRAAYDQFATAIAPFAKQLNFTQVISDATMGLARLARNAGDVGRNSSMMSDQIIKMIDLLTVASTKGLTPAAGDNLRKMVAEIDRYTVKLNSDHLPVVKKLSSEYRTFHDSVDKVVGKMLKTTERGALPDIIRDRFAPPDTVKPIALEEWIGSLMGGGERVFKKIGDKYNQQWMEIFQPPGQGQGKKLTVADMFGTGRLELIDQVITKTQSYGRAIDYVANRLSTPGEFENFYQPIMKSAEALGLLVQRIRQAVIGSAEMSPRMASVVLSLDTAQTALSHTTQSFDFMKKSVENLNKSGGVVTDQWSNQVQKGLEGITQTSTKVLQSNTRQYQERLKGIIRGSGSSPEQIYSAIKEAMKLPSAMGKEPLASKGIGELLFGGGKESLMSSIPFDRLMQVKGALGEYVTEIVESGFGFKSIQRARISVGKLFNEIKKEINSRQIQAYNEGSTLPAVAPGMMPSRWQQETPKLAVHMKGAMKAIFEGIEEASPEMFPSTNKLVEKTSKWSLKQIDALISNLKRKGAQLHREFAAAMVPGEIDLSGSQQKMIVKGVNWEHAIAALEKSKQNVIFRMRKDEARQAGKSLATPAGTPEALASVAAGEDVVLIKDSLKGSKEKVVSSIDEMTQAKVAALKRQVAQMKGVEPGKALKAIEEEAVGILQASAKSGGADAIVASLFGGGGKESTASKNLSNLINPFVMLNDQIETLGHAVGKQGQPLAMWGELAKAARQQVFDLLREVSKTGISTNYLDEQVAKFNATASDDKKVKSFTELQDHIQTLKQSLATAMPEYMESLNAGDAGVTTTKRKELVDVIGMLNKAFVELESTVAATLNTEALANDLHKREITTIRELGQAYRMAKLEASESMGPFAAGAQQKVGETAFAGREIAAQSLITSAWNTTGTAPGGMFAGIGAPAATIDDLFVKLLAKPDQLKQLGSGIGKSLEAFRELNNAFSLGVVEPKNLDILPARFERIHKVLESGRKLPATWAKSFETGLATTQDFMRQVLTKLNTESQSSTESQFSINLVKGIQKSRDEARSLINEIELLIKTAERASTKQGTLGAQQTRIRLFETIKQKQEQLGATGLALELDKEAPPELKGAVADVGVRLAGASKNVLSIWERLTNTVKTTRNNFADLFMYQVRWYTSMMLFWGVLNKVGETFKGLVSTQHEIQRAVRAMRDETGELVTHWERLEKIATIHIFESMIKWATDAKLAGEALWQLGSAGLTASESIAALGPVVGLIRATEGSPEETTKIVAGVYNTLQDAIEGNVSASAKFRIITDVMSKTFREHQVELSELNQGYRYAITSADMAGLSFYELSGILGVLNDNMIKGSRAGRGLQQVLTHIAKEPYAIAASFIELGKHMNVPAEAMSKLTSGDLKKMSTMELLREFAKIAQSSGKSLEGLGRIMESFDMIGGRTLAPLLLNFDKVDKSTRDLVLHSAGATESMASRMATTIQANMRRIASYFQAAVYPVITGVHHGLTAIMNFVGGTALALQGLQSKVIMGGFKFAGMEGAGTFLDTGLKAATMLGTLTLLSGQLPGKFDVVSKALTWMGEVGATNFTRLGVLFINLANSGPAIVGFFSSMRTHLTTAATAAKSFTLAMATTEFWTGWGSSIVSACNVARVAVAAFFAEWWKMGLLKGVMFGLKESILGIGQAFGFVATLFSRHPIMMAITAISLAIGGMAYYFRVWKQSYDDMVTAATEADAKYQERLGKIEQRAVAAAHAQAETESSKATWDSLTAGMEGTTRATEEQKAAYDSYTSSLGINDRTTRINGVSVQTLRDQLEELSPVIKRNTSAIRGHRNALAHDKELIDAYIESVKKQRDVIKAAEEKKQKVDTAEEDPRENWFKRDYLNRVWNVFEPGFAQRERQRRQKLYEEMQNEAADDLSSAQKNLADRIGSRVTSQTQGPLQVFIKSLTDMGKSRKEVTRILSDAFTAPDKDIKDWTPALPESIDDKKIPKINWTQVMRDAMPSQSEEAIKTLVKEKMSLRFLVGENFAKEIEQLDLSKAADMMTAKKLLMFGQLQAHSRNIINVAMDSMKISIGDENARKKAQDATDKANEALLKSQENFYKKWTEIRMTYEEARLASMEKGFTADLFSRTAFALESNRLDEEYIATQEQFALKRKELEREHPELDRPQMKAKLNQLNVDERIALMEVDKQRLELIKKIGDATQKAWQEGQGETLKYEASMKNVKARTLEAEAAEKIAKIERDIASNVRASSQEVQEAHGLKMAAYKAELEAKKLELQYNLTGEKLKLDAEINALKDPEKLKAMSPEQRKFAADRVSILERQRSHAESLFQANLDATNAEARRKASEEERRVQKQHLDVLVQNVKVALGEIEQVQAQSRTTMTGGSLGIGINAPIEGRLTSTFYDSRKGRPQGHRGGDIAAPAGTPFYAPTDLDIRNTREQMSDSPGGMVWGVDAQGVWHKFHHVKPGVQAGQHIKVGEQLGVLSNIKGPHLDYKMQDAAGNYIDWMTAAGLSKGARIGGRITGNIPLSTVMPPAGPGGESEPQTLADALKRLFAKADEIIKTEGPKGKSKLKTVATEILNSMKDMQIEPDQLLQFQSVFDSLEALWQKLGLKMKKFYPLILDSYKRMFDRGVTFDIPVLVKYSDAARKAGETEEQIRKRIFEVDKIAFENEANWTAEKFGGLMRFIDEGAKATGISGKKLNTYLFAEVFSPSKLQTMLDSDIELMDMFYQELSQLSRNLTGGIPTKVMKSFESAIKAIISSGEELDPQKYQALVNTLAQIPKINLKEAADSIEKYWQTIANTRSFSVQDFGKMQADMLRFGATQGEVWKAIGDVADVQIRRLYADWETGAKGMNEDMTALKAVGEAFWLGMIKGVADFASKIKDPIRQLAESVTQIMTDMQSTLQTVLEDSLKNDWKGWSEYSTKFGENMIKLASKNISEMAMGSLSNLIGKALGLPEPPKPGQLSQAEAEKQGKGFAEQTSRLYVEATAKETKRTADGVEKLVTLAEQGKTGVVPRAGQESESKGTASTAEKAGGAAGGAVPGITVTEEAPSMPRLTIPRGSDYKVGQKSESAATVKTGDTEAESPDVWDLFLNPDAKTAKTTPEYGEPGYEEATEPSKGFFDYLMDWAKMPVVGFAKGGVVPGSGSRDSVRALLTPGEIVIPKGFVEGGEVENPLQSLLTGVGEMVQGMMAPLTKMMSPRAQQIAQIGEGNYGGTFESQAAWDDQFEQVRGMYRQQDAQKYAEYQKGQIQQALGGGGGGSPLSMIPIIGGLFKSEGGLIQKFGLGGLVQFLATGGSVLQKDINPSLYQAHVTSDGKLYSNWPDKLTAKPTPWYQKMLPWLMMAPLLLSFLGDSGKDKGAKADIDAVTKQFDQLKMPDLQGKGLDQMWKENVLGLPSQGDFGLDWVKSFGKYKKGPGWLSDINSDILGFAAGGPVIQTRSESERPWQNMGHTETVYEGSGSTWWQAIRPYLLTALPLLLSMAKKKKATPADSSSGLGSLGEQLGSLQSPNLEPKSMDDMFKNYLTGGSGEPGSLGSAWTKYLEKGKATDWLSDAKLDKSLFDTSALQSSLSQATSAPSESGGILSSLGNLFSGGGGGFLSNLGSLGSSLWGGIKSLGSGLLSIFGFAEGGQVPRFAEGGLFSGLLSSGLGLVGSIFGPIGSMIGSIGGSLFGGLFGGKKKDDSSLSSMPAGGGLFSGLGGLGSSLMGGLGSLGSGILGIGKSLFSGIGSLFGFAEGGFVDSLLDMLGPSQAQAMPLDQVMPSLTAGWEKGLNDLIAKNPDVKNQSDEFLKQAKLGVSDVTNFLKDKPNMFEPINELIGSVNIGQQSGGWYRQFNESIQANLDPLQPGNVDARQSIANVLFHETAHGLTKSGRSLAPFLNQIDPKETLAWANELVKNGQLDPKDVEYWSDPYEVMARGVAGHLQQSMDPKVGINPREYPPEYRELFVSLAKGLETGKMPKAPGGVGILETLRRSVTDIQAGRLPTAVFGYASGGTIPGAGEGDTVPAMLTPGEFVVNKRTVNLFGPQFFHALQDLAKTRGAAASPDVVLAGARQNLKFAAGGVIPKLPPVSTAPTENKITVATVMDEESVGQFLNTKKYGEVLVNKLGSGVTRRMQGGQGI